MEDRDRANRDYEIDRIVMEFPYGGKEMLERIYDVGHKDGFDEGLFDEGEGE